MSHHRAMKVIRLRSQVPQEPRSIHASHACICPALQSMQGMFRRPIREQSETVKSPNRSCRNIYGAQWKQVEGNLLKSTEEFNAHFDALPNDEKKVG